MAKQETSYLEEKLDQLGRLLIFTRQMDMMMHTDAHVEHLTECFLNGNYCLDPALTATVDRNGECRLPAAEK